MVKLCAQEISSKDKLIKADTAYRLNDKHEFEEVNQ